ncbi:NAD(P)H-dependent flavin oxidoreductase [Acinetobacter shaoyimingii]|uniref:Nitronate monooxygenase n=1 Tax=Acinetobacter shaoyimingii TaxID=2715164 RepID=A0A6G8RUP4_9GAMM|nr:nitronate monooxygenase [Acinetobacter shaoyimingii]QIO05611.1 nitronate monooxygenase [Acinetobacter shaoyimingii]
MSVKELLSIDYNIFLAPMAGVSTPELAAEVSNHGGLGSLGLGASTVEDARQQILKTQSLTDKSFQVNFFCHETVQPDNDKNQQWIEYLRPQFERFGATLPTELKCIYPSFKDNDDFLNLILETKPKAVSFHFGLPHAHQIDALKKAGIVTMVSATNINEARAIQNAGIDIVIAQGIEAGGHRGTFNPSIDSCISTVNLVKLFKTEIEIPIVAAGGIMNGFQAQHFINLGASAVQLGTAFVQCKSSGANAAYRKALFSKQPLTQITSSISGRPARGLQNHWAKDIDVPERVPVAPYPYAYDLAKQLNSLASQQGDTDYGAFWAGSNVGQIRELDAEELILQLRAEMHEYD